MSYEKKGHSFTIVEIYEKPLQLIDNRSIYKNFIMLIVSDYLIRSKQNNVILTANRILLYMHMYHENYSYCTQYISQLSKYTNIDTNIIYEFYNTSNSGFRSALEAGLNGLRNKALILYEKIMFVCTDENIHRKVSSIEKDYITIYEKEALKELGFENIQSIRVSNKWYLFKSTMIKRLKEIDLKYYYNCYDITVNRKYIEDDHKLLLSYTLNEVERNGLKNELNNTVMNRLMENAHTRQDNVIVNSKDNKSKMRIQDNYIGDISTLINLLIDINANNIKYDIESIMRNEKEELEIIAGLEDLFT